jgi:hypothetical protein
MTSNPAPKIKINESQLTEFQPPGKTDDFVLTMTAEHFEDIFRSKIDDTNNIKTSYDFEASFEVEINNELISIAESRIHACKTRKGTHFTLFIRTTGEPFANIQSKTAFQEPSAIDSPDNYDLGGSHYSEAILKQIPSSGLLAIFGQTKSGKSELAKWLCYKLLPEIRREAKSDSLLNVLMIGNPIEKFWHKTSRLTLQTAPAEWQKSGFNLILRNQQSDYETLKQALLSDAKRQTPRLVFVHEVQNSEEWPVIVDFALTGHLVIATGHASNVREGISTILRSYDATTPQQRATVARALHTVAHCKMEQVNDTKVQFVSFWGGKPEARNALTKFGQGAILPHGNGVHSYSSSFEEALNKAQRNAVSDDAKNRLKTIGETAPSIARKLDFEQIFS